MLIREVDEPFPVIHCDIMLARPDVVADSAHERLLETGHLGRRQTVRSQQPVHRAGMERGQELAAGIRP